MTALITSRIRWLSAFCLATTLLFSSHFTLAQSESTTVDGLPSQTWSAGTHLASFPEGGRIATFHRGVLYLGGNRTYYYDISDPQNPQRLRTINNGDNGHRWWKMGDLFQREYVDVESSNFAYTDLSNIGDGTTPWTDTSVPLQIGPPWPAIPALPMFPHYYASWANGLEDVRTPNSHWQRAGNYTPQQWNNLKGLSSSLFMRVGNLVFYMGMEGTDGGVSAVDIGNPANARLRDIVQGGFRQYTTGTFIWRHYIILMIGSNSNEGGHNLVAVDFSDPDNLTYEPLYSFPTGTVTNGRYVAFQDKYAFIPTHHGNRVIKLDMETREVVLQMTLPSGNGPVHDFWPMPLGHLLVATGNETGNGDTHIFVHQSGLDTTPPKVDYHLPRHGDTNQPVTSVIGLVINETLDDTTINGSTIQVRPVGGVPIQTDIVSSNYNVINIAPRQPLQQNTTYEVRILQNGIRDVAGNGINTYSFRFSTGNTVDGGGNEPPPEEPPPEEPPPEEPPPVNPPSITDVSTGLQGPATAGVGVNFSVTVQGGNGTLEYRWQFGDGNESGWVDQASVNHSYQEAGDYTVAVQVRDSQGSSIAQAFALVVAESGVDVSDTAQDRLARLRSSPIVADGGNGRVWVVNPDTDTVSIIDPDDLVVANSIQVCHRPMSVSLDANWRAWVVCRDSDEIQVLNTDGNILQTINLPRGSRPVSLAMSLNGDTAYVALYATGELHRFDTGSFANTGTLAVGRTPWAIAVAANGQRLWVTRLISGDSGGEITPVNLSGFTLADPVLLALDTDSAENGLSARGIPNYVSGIAPSPGDTDKAWYSAKKDNIFRGLARDGQPLTHDTTVRSLVGKLDLSLDEEMVSERVDVDDSSQPSAVALSAWGAHLLVTLQGNNELVVLSQHSGDEVARANVGLAPQGVAIDSWTQRIFVQNFMGRSVTVLDGEALFTQGARDLPLVGSVVTVPSNQELLPSQVLQGKRIFYNAADSRMGLEGYLSCAGCHLEGGHDGRVLDFTDRGEGLRSTISMRGRGGPDHGLIHWSGNFDEMQDFEHDIRDAFGGSGFMTHEQFNTGTRNHPLGDSKTGVSSQLDALAAYVHSLTELDPSPHRANDGNLTTGALQGRQVFEQFQCTSCHAGPAFTNSWRGQLHDVGTLTADSGQRLGETLTGIDTPSLHSLWDRSHYLHDGSAATLDAVLSHSGSALHGGMNLLNGSERAQLASYLLQIDESEYWRFPEPPQNLVVE